jgi:hypothetical protein
MPETPTTRASARSIVDTRLRPFLTAVAALTLISGGAAPVIALTPDAVVRSAPAVATSPSHPSIDSSSLRLDDRGEQAAQSRSVSGGSSQVVQRAPKKAAVATPKPARHKTTTIAVRATSYRGTNHVWIPSLGINRSVSFFSCSRSAAPNNLVYRWGCAGSNNVYLLGHAWGVFKALHDAYYSGRVRKGMRVIYADGGGHVHSYSVAWWKVVSPTTAASWAWASLSRPGMTLQTCLGSNSQYRLMVRLSRIG